MPVKMTNDFSRATLYVLEDVAAPGQRITWNTMFRPCLLASQQLVLRGDGPWIRHEPSFTTSTFVYLTREFQQQHVYISDLIKSCLRPGVSSRQLRWKLLGTREEWEAKRQAKTAKRFPFHCLCLCTEKEKHGERGWKKLRGVMTSRQFVSWRLPRTVAQTYLGQAQL